MLTYDSAWVAQRPMRSYTWKNQSLVGVTNRLFRHLDADAASTSHTPIYVNVVDLKFATVNAIIISVALALGILFISAMPQRAMRTAESDAIEFALLILMMLMITPLSFGYLFSWLILPFAVLAQGVLGGKGSIIIGSSLPAVAILALALPFPRAGQSSGKNVFAHAAL